ncbi:MAG: hypothetical protein HY329_05460 [Chloroflexi bacterium]|nr:hypothetical protein [Chloroflexota bacterium]
MSELAITLPRKKIPIQVCKERIAKFVREDAYSAYDALRLYFDLPPNTLTDEHIYALNAAMRARSSREAWSHFIGRELEALRRIPLDLDLVDSSDAEIEPGLTALDEIVGEISAKKGLGDMAASKALHLLRPRFVAISDSYVRVGLGIEGLYRTDVRRLRGVQYGMRAVGRDPNNTAPIAELVAYANTLEPVTCTWGRYKGRTAPVRLTKLRILDILLWSDRAGDEGHTTWAGNTAHP